LKDEADRIDRAERWLRRDERRILQERALRQQERLGDALMLWERFDAF
jgi:hypothetical protein